MKKGEFVKAVMQGSESELTVKEAEQIVGVVFRELGQVVSRKGRFVWPGFGTFTVKKRAAREGRNPRTGETMKVAASKTVAFKPAPTLKNGL